MAFWAGLDYLPIPAGQVAAHAAASTENAHANTAFYPACNAQTVYSTLISYLPELRSIWTFYGPFVWHAVCNKNNTLCKDSSRLLHHSEGLLEIYEDSSKPRVDSVQRYRSGTPPVSLELLLKLSTDLWTKSLPRP